jgi:serine O-acetyltransferase
VLRTLSETLDRQSLLEERVHELEQALSQLELPAPPIRTRELSPACEASIREALKEVIEPEVGINVVDLGLIREIKMNGQGVEVRMALIHPQCSQAGYLIEQVRRKVKGVIGDEPVEVVLTDEGGG